MCLMDWRLGRLVRAVTFNTAPGSGIANVAPNQQRVGVTVWSNMSGDLFLIDPTFTGVSGGGGAPSGICYPSQHITIATHGELPMLGFRIVNATNQGVQILWTEYFMTERALAAADDYLKREGFF